MPNLYRLSAGGIFSRPEENNQEIPLRVLFLSVEGNKTESDYFKHVEACKKELGIKSIVKIHILHRSSGDTSSAPDNVLDLLEEYIQLRDCNSLPERLQSIIPSEYDYDFVSKYLENNNSITSEKKKEFTNVLKKIGIDLWYEKFLMEYKGKYDVFGIIIDRDYLNHSVKQLNGIANKCQNKNYKFFITTPCIEFWLLMHLCPNIKETYALELQKFKDNPKISNKHTYTSDIVSKIAKHAKGINSKKFAEFYLANIEQAITQCESDFTCDIEKLIGNDSSLEAQKGELGSNLPELFRILREPIND